MAYTPEQNRVSKHLNRTLMNRVRVILHDSQLDKKLWSEIANMVIYIKNWTSTQGLARGSTPHKAWFGEEEWPDLSYLQLLGCNAYVHMPKEKRKKLDNHSMDCRLVGYNISNIDRLWDPNKKIIVQARDVVFDKNRQGTGDTSVQPEEDKEDVVMLPVMLPQGISSTNPIKEYLILAEEISSDHQERLMMERLTVEPVAAPPGCPHCVDCAPSMISSCRDRANVEDSAVADAPAPAPNPGNSDCPNPINSDRANRQGSAAAAPAPNHHSTRRSDQSVDAAVAAPAPCCSDQINKGRPPARGLLAISERGRSLGLTRKPKRI